MREEASDRDDRAVTTMTAPPRALRPTSGRAVAGVCRGLAEHLRLPVWGVRAAFIVLALAGGIGLVLYAAFWAVLPLAPDAEDPVEAERIRATDFTRLLAVAAVVIGLALLLAAFGLNSFGGSVAPDHAGDRRSGTRVAAGRR